MKLTTVIYSNGIVQSTWENGFPVDKYSGKIEALLTIKNDIKNKNNFDKNEQIWSVEYYFSSDPLSSTIIPIETKYVNSLISYLNVLNKIDASPNIQHIKLDENLQFTEESPEQDVKPEDLPY